MSEKSNCYEAICNAKKSNLELYMALQRYVGEVEKQIKKSEKLSQEPQLQNILNCFVGVVELTKRLNEVYQTFAINKKSIDELDKAVKIYLDTLKPKQE